MDKKDCLLLFSYNAWANQRVLSAAEKVTPQQFTAPAGLSHGSLRGALVHTLSAETIWRRRCQEGVSMPAHLAEADFPTLADLRTRWAEEMRAWSRFLESRQEADFGALVRYTRTDGQPHATLLWQICAHVVNHGTQFRAEAAVALTNYAASPGDLDMILYLRSALSD